jgi:hypothetical protein
MSQGFTKGTPIDTDPTLSLNSDIVVPSQSAVKTYVDTGLSTKVPTTRTLTINGTSFDLSADRSWTIAAGGSSATIGTTIDGSGGTITIGQKGYVQIPYACTITGWRLIANAAGSIVIDIYKNPAPTIPVTLVTTTGKPTLSGVQTNTSTSLGGWTTTAVAANDMIGFTVFSATTVSWVILQIFVTKI